jgi:hypothetical protein
MDGSSNGTMATYVYGIVGDLRRGLPALPGVGDARSELRSLEGDSCCAIVSDAPASFVEATAEDLQRHSDVLQKLLDHTSALVPLRFGTVYPSDEMLHRDLLVARREELQALLQRVENRVEARLKAFYVEDAVLGEVVAEHPQIAQLRQRTQTLPADATYYDRIRLGELVASALAAKRRRDGEALLTRLAPLAVDHVVEEEPHEWSLLTASFLLERSTLDDFHSEVARVADDAEQRLQLRCLAPLAPYSFVSLQLAPPEPEAAWAS